MGKCWGITKKLRRCRSNACENWLCQNHAAQPKYFVAVAAMTIALSYLAGLIPNPFTDRVGEQSRKPNIICEVDGRSLTGSIVNVIPNDYEQIQVLQLRNTGDKSAGTVQVDLYVKDVPKWIHSIEAFDAVGTFFDSSERQIDLKDYTKKFNLFNSVAFSAGRSISFSLACDLNNKPNADKAIPAMLRIFSDLPKPLDMPFTINIIASEAKRD